MCGTIREFSMWKNYETTTNLIEESSEIRTATLLSCIGMDGFELYETLDFAEEGDQKQIDRVLKHLEMHFVGEVKETFERFKFNQRNQEVTKGIDGYVNSLRSMVKTCNFTALEDSLLRDRIVMGIHEDSTHKKLLQTRNLDLKLTINICHRTEISLRQVREMRYTDKVQKLHSP